MTFFIIALLISGASLLVPGLISFLLVSERDIKSKILFSHIIAFVIAVPILYFIYWKANVGFYGPFPFFVEMIIGPIISLIIIGIIADSNYGDCESRAFAPASVILGLSFIGLLGILIFAQSSAIHSKDKAALIGKVEVVEDLSKAMAPIDPVHICLVSESMGHIKAQEVFGKMKVSEGVIPGSRYKIGTGTKQNIENHVWWIFPVDFQNYFKWNQNRQVPGYIRVSAEDPFAPSQVVQYDKTGAEIQMKYLNSACFKELAKRYARRNGYLNTILADWTFEVNDDWRPYYTASILTRTLGFSGWTLKGILLFDVQTGKMQEFDKDSIPSWIDRGMPLKTLNYQITKWGKYNQAKWWYCLWHDDKSQVPTPGWYLTYGVEGKCEWFTGFTSTNVTENSLLGFTLSDARTGKTTYYKTSGVTEIVAYDNARSLWSNYEGYAPQELVVYNLYGELTYVVAIAYNGLFKGVSLISLKNKDINAKGNTLEEALGNYRIAISKSSNSSLSPSSGELQVLSLTGKISRVGMPLSGKENVIFSFTLSGVDKLFQISYSYSTPEPVVMTIGDEVKVTFFQTLEKVIHCETFDILNLEFVEESPTQARYLDAREGVKQEASRISEIQDRETLINSDKMKNVDPQALEEFLKQQNKK